MIKILLVDDQKVIREQLKSYFEPEADLQIVDTAANSIEALDKIKLLQPQIVLMDVEMPGGFSGLELTSIISDLFPLVKVIILTGNYTEEYGEQAVRVGAGAYLAKSTSAEGLIAAIKQLCPLNHLVALGNSSLLSREPVTKIINYNNSRHDQSLTVNADQNQLLATAAQPVDLQHQPTQSRHLFQFFRRGIILNSLVWITAFLYLKFTPPTYTSHWGVKILNPDSTAAVAFSDGEQVIPPTTASIDRDLRHDYLYVAHSPKLLTEAATIAQMTVADYQKPKITVDEHNEIIAFQIKGNSPELARNKAQAFHQTLTQQIDSLRQQELARQQAVNQTTLTKAKANLVSAQNKLSQYWAEVGINTDEQIKNLTDNLESLRRQQVELIAQQKIVANRYSQLDQEPNNLSVLKTDEGGKLIEDVVYPQYQAQSTPIQNSLASFDVLVQSNSASDLDQNPTEWQLLTAQNQELSAQIDILSRRLLRMTDERMQEASLKQDLQVAQTAVTNASAKLNQDQEHVDAIYPQIQLVTAPNLPHKPSNPNPGFVFKGGLLGSLLVTVVWTLL